MSEHGLTDPGPVPAIGKSRGHVLEAPRVAGDAVPVPYVAEHTGLHPNTARFHLDGLVDAGLAERAAKDRVRPGRPRMVYRAT